MTKQRIYLKTFGCQMNFYDSERIIDSLKPLGFELTDDPSVADISILNTCHIREKAAEKVFSDLGRLRNFQKNKDMIIAVVGCVAQAEGKEILKRAPYVDMVFGPQTYHRLPEMVAKTVRQRDQKKLEGKTKGIGIIDVDFPVEPKFDKLPQDRSGDRVSRFLSIQEGCDKFCTFCVVPYTRGAEYSRPVEDVVAEARRLVDHGAKEITVLGQNVNAYHGYQSVSDKSEKSLADLLYALNEVGGLERIRYTTSHPIDMSQDLIEAHGKIDKLMPYLHLPVQSGSDRILKLMHRRHDIELYKDVIHRLREARADIVLSSDFIVGYPGESDKDFQMTIDLVKEIEFAQAYSFKYSPRPGTPASINELQVPEEVKSKRLKELQEVLFQQQYLYNVSKKGQTLEVLVEHFDEKSQSYIGRSPYMQLVRVQSKGDHKTSLIGNTVLAYIDEAYQNSLVGEILTIEENNRKVAV